MSPTHLSPEPGIPSLPPLPPVDANNPESAPVPLLPAPAVGGPSNNVPTTADAFFSPKATTTHPFDGEVQSENVTQSSDSSVLSLFDTNDERETIVEEGKSKRELRWECAQSTS